MGRTTPCSSCGAPKSPLATECVECGDNPHKRIDVVPGTLRKVPAGRGLVRGVHAQWHRLFAKKIAKDVVELDAHLFCEHACLLRKLKIKFDQLDRKYGFDDVWFFLRGGFPYFSFLNLYSRMRLRATVFPGLAVPDLKLAYFSTRIEQVLRRAIRLKLPRIDIAVIDEVDSGSGMNRFHKLLEKTLDGISKDNPSCFVIVIHRIMIKRKSGTPKVKLQANLRTIFRKFSGINASYRDVVLEGAMLGYDNAEVLGIIRNPKTHRYRPKLYSANTFQLTCPKTQKLVYSSAPGNNDIPSYISCFSSDLASEENSHNTQFLIKDLRLNGCRKCKVLEKKVNPSRKIQAFRPSV